MDISKSESEIRKTAATKMTQEIYDLIRNSGDDMIKYSPDALLRVFVLLSKRVGIPEEKLKEVTLQAIEFYYKDEE